MKKCIDEQLPKTSIKGSCLKLLNIVPICVFKAQ